MNYLSKTKLTTLVLAAAIVICGFATNVRNAHAFSPAAIAVMTAPNPAAVPVGDIAVVTNTASSAGKELFLDGIISSATKVVISNLTQSIVSWINSGFEGSPAFVTNPQGYLVDLADQTAGDFLENYDGDGDGVRDWDFLCQPFSLNIRIALNLGYNSTYKQENFCRLSDVVANAEDFAKFTDGDFSKGGWESWFEVSQNPSNNPYGSYFAAKRELELRTSKATISAERELNWGDGLLSWRECEHRNTDDECDKFSDIKTPGSVINDQLSTTLGTGFRQLELADEFNEIVGALIGQLTQTVLTQGLSSFSSSGSNFGTLSGESPNELVVSCRPSQAEAVIGEEVRWTAQVVGNQEGTDNTPRFTWSGHPEIQGETDSRVYATYYEPGEYHASVEVDFVDDFGNTVVTYTENCISGLTVTLQ